MIDNTRTPARRTENIKNRLVKKRSISNDGIEEFDSNPLHFS